jgi:hypothetical protein
MLACGVLNYVWASYTQIIIVIVCKFALQASRCIKPEQARGVSQPDMCIVLEIFIYRHRVVEEPWGWAPRVDQSDCSDAAPYEQEMDCTLAG